MKTIANINTIKKFFRKFGIKPHHFIIPTLLSLSAAFFEAACIGLLIPATKGAIAMNFNFVKELPLIGDTISRLSRTFSVDAAFIFVLLIGLIFIAAVLKNIFRYLSSLMISLQIRKIADNMRMIIFGRYLSFGKPFFDHSNIGHLQNILLNFTKIITNQLSGVEQILTYFFFLTTYLIIMFVISIKITLLMILIFPILNYVSKWIIGKLKKTSLSYTVYYNELSGMTANILSNMSLVKLYSNEENERRNFAVLSSRLRKLEFSMDKKQALISPLQEIILLIAILSLISATSFMIFKGNADKVADFFVYLYLLKMSMTTFANFNTFIGKLAVAKGPFNAMMNILDEKDKFFISEGTSVFKGLNAHVELKHINFSYLKEHQVLKDLSFVIEKNKMTAIVGPTGAGKTTIINLILRFYDCPPGTIFLDGTDIREFTIKSLMKHMALVSQDTMLFNDTIRNNIIYGLEEEVSEKKLIDAVKKARLLDFISGLTNGFDTYIGDKGVRLSGGEKQRMAIARSLLKGASILILDEATSSLDTKTEKLIQEAIDEMTKDRTTIVIAHRLSTIKNADKIVVVEHGQVQEEGQLVRLLDKRGKFYTYWQEQKFY